MLGDKFLIAEITDIEFIEEFIAFLLTSNDRNLQDDIITVAKKLIDNKLLDILIDKNTPDGYVLNEMLKHILLEKISLKPNAIIREELLSNTMYKDRLEYILARYEKKVKNNKQYINLVKNKLKLSSLYKMYVKFNQRMQEIITNIRTEQSFEKNIDIILRDLNSLYKEIIFDRIASEFIFSDASGSDFEGVYELYYSKDKTKQREKLIKTGISVIDALFNNYGLPKGNIYMFSAPYGMGKTRFLSALALRMFSLGYNTYHITIENEKDEIIKLYMNILLGLSDDEIEQLPKERVLKEIELRIKSIKEKYDNHLEIKKLAYKSNPQDIEMYILQKLEINNAKPDVILIDHVDLLYPLDKNKTDLFGRFEDVMMDLKNIAEKYNIAIITASQLNREGIKQRKDISLSFGDVVSRSMAKNELVSFHAILQSTPEENLSNFMRIYVDKNRFGLQNIVFPIYFDKSRCEIREILNNEDFDIYIQSISGLLNQNQKTQRIVNIMRQFIQSLNDRIGNDYVSYQQNIMRAFHNMKNSLNDIDEFIEDDEIYNTESDDEIEDDIIEYTDTQRKEIQKEQTQNIMNNDINESNLKENSSDNNDNDTSYINDMFDPLKIIKRFDENKDFDELEIQREILGDILDENAYKEQDRIEKNSSLNNCVENECNVIVDTVDKNNINSNTYNNTGENTFSNNHCNNNDTKLKFEMLAPGSFKSFIEKAKKDNIPLEKLIEDNERYNQEIKERVLKSMQNQQNKGDKIMYKNRNLKLYMDLLSEKVNYSKIDNAIKTETYQDFEVSSVKDLISVISLNILKFHSDGLVNKERMIRKKKSKKSGREFYKIDALHNLHYRYFIFLDDDVVNNIYENILPYYYEKYGISKKAISRKEFLSIILLLGVFDNGDTTDELITLYDMEYIPKRTPIVIENMVDASDVFYDEKITKGTIENIRLVIEELRESSKNRTITIDDDVMLLVFKNVVIAISYNTFENLMNYIYDKLVSVYENESIENFIQRITSNFKFINIVNAIEKVKPYVLTLDNFLICRYLSNLSMLSYLINTKYIAENQEEN